MSIAFDLATTDTATGTTHAFNHTCTGSNGILFVTIGDLTSTSVDVVTGVTYNTVPMTRVDAMTSGGGNTGPLFIYMLVGPATGTHSVSISTSSSVQTIATALSYTGASQSGQPDNHTHNYVNNGNSPITTSLTPVADGCWEIGAVNAQDFNVTADAGVTNTRNTTGGYSVGDSGVITPAASYSMSWTWTGSNHVSAVQVSFSPISSGLLGRALLGVGR